MTPEEEIEKLKAEVERLRKPHDEWHKALSLLAAEGYDDEPLCKRIEAVFGMIEAQKLACNALRQRAEAAVGEMELHEYWKAFDINEGKFTSCWRDDEIYEAFDSLPLPCLILQATKEEYNRHCDGEEI